MKHIVNFLGLKIGWIACVVGAANGMGWVGPLVVCGVIGIHLSLIHDIWGEIRIIVLVALFGSTIDTVLAGLGAFSYSNGWSIKWLSPIWMVALWANFAMSLNVTMRWLKGRYLLAAAIGGGRPL